MGHGKSGGGSKYAEGSRAGGVITPMADQTMALALQSSYMKWYESLSPEERALISEFSYGGFKEINRAASGGTNDPALAAKVAQLQTALLRSKIPQTMTVFRGVDTIISAQQARQMIGTTVGKDHFISTSLNFETAHEFTGWRAEGNTSTRTIYQFTLPKGLHGALISPLSGNRNEHEVLLPKGARFRIVGVRTFTYRGVDGSDEPTKTVIIQAKYLGV